MSAWLARWRLALRIARLQLRVDQSTQHYRALVGDLLHTLGQAKA